MNPRTILLILVAGLGVLAVMFLTRTYLSGMQRQAQQVQVTEARVSNEKVLVAARDLPAGTILKAEDVKWQPWPEDGMNEAYFSAKADKLADMAGKVLRAPVRAQAPVVRSAIVAPGDRGFLAAALTPGMRAVAVKVSPVTGISGFIFTGDRVDVILTHVVGESRAGKLPISETVFQNVRVLALDQRATEADNQAKLAKTVTLEVTPKMAEKMAMLENIGTLSLSLRSLVHNTEGEDIDVASPPIDRTTSATLGTEISSYLPSLDPSGKTDQVIVRRGSSTDQVTLGEESGDKPGNKGGDK